jgi:hypothetical protein
MSVEITALINTQARGPIGPAGTNGTNGSDATVTAANTLTALQAMTTAQETASRDAIAAQSTAIGFLDRFDYSTRYAENATLTHNSSLPEVGGTAYRINTNGATRPKIVAGALEPMSDSLDYFANVVTTTGGKFNLGVVVEFKRSSVYLTAANNGGFTIAVSEQELVSAGGSIGGISGTNPIHVTIRPDGISDAGFYLGASFTCLNATVASGVYPWTSRTTQLPFGEKQAILFRINGDILEVEAVGVGTLYFYHADISTRVAATTYFFYEPVGPDQGTDYKQTARLYRWWVNADEYDQIAGYGGTVPQVTGGPHRFPGTVQLFPNGQTAKQSANTLPGSTTASLYATGASTVTKGSYTRPTGGAIVLESQLVQNFGYNEGGADQNGFQLGAIDTNLNAVVSSTAGAETNFNNCGPLAMWGFENGDWQEWTWNGQLVGANNKRIRINIAFGGGDPGTPGNLIDSGTITTAGFYEIRLHRYTNSTNSHTFYATMHANGALVAATRTIWNGTTNYVGGTYKVTTVDAGGVTVDAHTHRIARVNMT